jgi:hypothetical protein
MKQVGFWQEAARLGGIGSCGRELCCSTWLTDFRSVNTSAARYQQLSLNPQKLAGQCGKLKCCLNYELDTYMDALKGFPDFDTKLVTEKGDAICQKQDIFKGLMWFAYTNNFANWHVLTIEKVQEIIAENKLKKKVSALEDYVVESTQEIEKDFNNAMGQESLTRFDQAKRKKRPVRKPKVGVSSGNEGTIPKIIKPIIENKPNNARPSASNAQATTATANTANATTNNNKPQNNRPKKPNNRKPNPNKNTVAVENKPSSEPRKPIIITKNENKK